MFSKITFLIFFLSTIVLTSADSLCSTEKVTQLKPIFIFAHGIFDSKKQAYTYKKILQEGILLSFDFDDSLVFPYLHRPFTTCFGQNVEIKKLAKIYNAVIHYFESKQLPIPPIILVGLSRGASVILSFLAIRKPQHIKAVILESPFDHMEYVLGNIISNTSAFSVPFRLLFSIIFPFYYKKGIQPLHLLKDIDKNIAMLFIASFQDQRVPYHHTLMLYHLLKQQGHQKLFLHIFDKGLHGKIVKNNKTAYKEVVKNFLKTI